MNISNKYISILVYFYKLSYEVLHLSDIQYEVLVSMYGSILYIYRGQNLWTGMNSSDNYVGILGFTKWSIFNEFILKLYQTFNVISSELLYNLYIYHVKNQFSGMNISANYVSIFQYSSYLNTLWVNLDFYPLFHVILSLWKYDLYIQLVYNEDR